MLNVWAIEVDEGCEVRQGEDVHIDHNDGARHYVGDYTCTGIFIDDKGRVEVSVQNMGGDEVWIPISSCEW